MSDQKKRPSDAHDSIEQATGGFAGQTGYNSDFTEGHYDNASVVPSEGTVDDRAGSYESGYATPDRDSALTPQSPRDAVGDNEPSNNYTEGRELDSAGNLVVEE
ncbi:MAG: hypothetical protein H0T53_07060 [Herpetosiphonaceae bacterium]|nr:hypothetical protein [Herpetosiphonaceae bacterium]